MAITEKQLLKMPKKDYMNEEQRGFFKQLLIDMRQEALDSIEEARQQMASLGADTKADPADTATDYELAQFLLRTSERKTQLLRKVDKSLKRIDDGTYGYCEETGEPIGLQRMLARPTATLSIDAKENQEFHEKTEGISRVWEKEQETE